MLPSTPRRPASAGPTGRDIVSPSNRNRQLPQLPPLGAPIQLDLTNGSDIPPGKETTARRAILIDIVVERDGDGRASEGQLRKAGSACQKRQLNFKSYV